jgi:hypothetical protein
MNSERLKLLGEIVHSLNVEELELLYKSLPQVIEYRKQTSEKDKK